MSNEDHQPPHPIESLLLLLQSIGNLLLFLYGWPFVGLHYYLTSHVRNTTYEKCMSKERTMTTLAWQPQNHHHHAHSLLQGYELAGRNNSTSIGMLETGIHIDIYIYIYTPFCYDAHHMVSSCHFACVKSVIFAGSRARELRSSWTAPAALIGHGLAPYIAG
jgi:hypothetical protein